MLSTQFVNPDIRSFTVGTTGTPTALATGSFVGMFWLQADANNTGEVRLSTQSDGSPYLALEAGVGTPWIPGGFLGGYYYHGTVATDQFYMWSLR
jgi:hypothetical protein